MQRQWLAWHHLPCVPPFAAATGCQRGAKDQETASQAITRRYFSTAGLVVCTYFHCRAAVHAWPRDPLVGLDVRHVSFCWHPLTETGGS